MKGKGCNLHHAFGYSARSSASHKFSPTMPEVLARFTVMMVLAVGGAYGHGRLSNVQNGIQLPFA